MLSRRHGTKRVRASLVYNEFIAHKTHTHMNSTHWETLTSFVLYLGKVSDDPDFTGVVLCRLCR